MDVHNRRSKASIHIIRRLRHTGYEIVLLLGAAYWLGAAWVAFDLRVPMRSRIARRVPAAERMFYGCAALLASGALLRSLERSGKSGSRSWIIADLSALVHTIIIRPRPGPRAAPRAISKAGDTR